MERCYNCGKEFEDDELHEVSNFDDEEIDHVCAHCLEEFYTKCDQCGLYRPDEAVTYLPDLNMHLCDLCLDTDSVDAILEYESSGDENTWRD